MTIFNAVPFTLTNGTTADATQVMADFNQIINDGNTSAAHNGANSDITSLSGITSPFAYAIGGSGTTTSTPFTPWAVATGTADAIAAAYSPVNGSLFDGLSLGFRATAANATTTPTFSPDGLPAHVITKFGGSALGVGDIPAALAECVARYNLANTRWELQDPASTGVSSIADATNGGLNFSAATGAVTASLKPADLLTKASPATTDSVVVMDAAASNAAKTSLISAILALASGAIIVPQGRLTLVTGGPVMTTTQSAKTSIFYTPYNGSYYPVYSGTAWSNRTIAEVSVALDTTNFLSGVVYDLFLYNDAGTDRLGYGPSWATGGGSTTARGTGAGSTAIQQLAGIWTNTNSITLRYDSTHTTVVAANRATYVGTALASANGQTQFIFGASGASGTAGQFNLFNAYNRVQVSTVVQDSTATYTYNSNTFHAAHASNTMRVSYVVGLNETPVQASYSSFSSGNGAGVGGAVAIGVNSTSVVSGATGSENDSGGLAGGEIQAIISTYAGYPGLGANFIQALEAITGTPGLTTFTSNSSPYIAGFVVSLTL